MAWRMSGGPTWAIKALVAEPDQGVDQAFGMDDGFDLGRVRRRKTPAFQSVPSALLNIEALSMVIR